MYETPIRLLVQQVETNMREQQEKQIFEAIQKCGVDVDRDELIKALAYDRQQYEKGYVDGRADAHKWISVEEQPEPPEDDVYYCYGFWIGSGRKQAETAEYLCGEWKIANNFVLTHWMPLPEPPKED